MVRVAVIILNWNGEKWLKQFLPAALDNTNAELGKIVVVDNASSDGSAELMKREFPQVEYVQFDKNYGFAGGYNRAIALRSEEFVVLLNSDVEVAAGWLDPLVQMLDDEPSVVAVQPKIRAFRNKDHFEYAGACGGFIDYLGFPFCRGRILDVTEKDDGQYDDACEVFWCSGAALCIRKDAYLQVGGLDERFFAHMEEIDMCWRLRRRGGSLKVAPQSVVFHYGGGSLPMNHPRKLFLNYRNNLLMLYKNLDAKSWRGVRLRRVILDFAAACMFALKGEWANVKSVRQAYKEFNAMKGFYTQPAGPQDKDACIYRKSLIFKYYLGGRRTFSNIWK